MITPQSNLEALLSAMMFDGIIDLSKKSRNLCYKISEDDGMELWFVSLMIDTSNIEAYVVADKQGNFSYFDDSLSTVVINNVVIREEVFDASFYEQVIQSYQVDGADVHRPPLPGHIAAILGELYQMAS